MNTIVSWQVRPENTTELRHLVFVGFPVGLAISAVGLPLFYVLAEAGFAAAGGLVALALVGVGFWQGAVAVRRAGDEATEHLPRLRLLPRELEVPLGKGSQTLQLADVKMVSGWYDSRPGVRSVGCWVHLDAGHTRVTFIGSSSNARAKEVGMPMGYAPPQAEHDVRLFPADVADLWAELRKRGVAEVPPAA